MIAPYLNYKKTDAQAKAEGIKAGLEWQDKDHWRPGGPHFHRGSCRNGDQVWNDYCDTLERHNTLWREGWEIGNATRLQNREMATQMACLVPA